MTTDNDRQKILKFHSELSSNLTDYDNKLREMRENQTNWVQIGDSLYMSPKYSDVRVQYYRTQAAIDTIEIVLMLLDEE